MEEFSMTEEELMDLIGDWGFQRYLDGHTGIALASPTSEIAGTIRQRFWELECEIETLKAEKANLEMCNTDLKEMITGIRL